MSGGLLFALAGAALVALGLRAAFLRRHLFWKVLGLNVLANGVFLILVATSSPAAVEAGSTATAAAGAGAGADPVPQAMVLTGIVVAVSATALALGLALRVTRLTGRPSLPDPGPRS